ncbi:TerD family protein [Williamsia sp. D3]|uniref:TerD family protein n=1 Tax=Williamsia sp. D3 TaxID=1313067 RepID=UPI0003D348AA|nr:TerD family protein [Williamsia sp. D3]ETD31838.1 transporter [Williamsia sp. D3]
MKKLVAGQNAPIELSHISFRVAATGADVDLVGLVVDSDLRVLDSGDVVFYNQPATGGVRLDGPQLTIDLDGIRSGATVLCAVSAEPGPGSGVHAELTGLPHGEVLFGFDVRPAHGETALLCFELYQRAGRWRVRALGQGYSGGLAQLLTSHGVDVDDPREAESIAPVQIPGAAAAQPDSRGELDPASVVLGSDYTAAIARSQVVFEDAARSAAGYVQAEAFAMDRLDQELSDAISDPAQRNSPAASHQRERAQRRCDELIAAARQRFDADSQVLIAELAALDPQLPPAMASWTSPAWTRLNGPPASGVRIGEFAAPERGELRLPFCVPTPIARPIWVLDGDLPALSAVTSLVLRLVVAARAVPSSSTTAARSVAVDVFDLTGSLAPLSDLLTPLLGSAAVTSADVMVDRLGALESSLELAQMALEAGDVADVYNRVVVIADLPFGWDAATMARLLRIIDRGGRLGWSFVLSGAVDEHDADPLVSMIADRTLMFPMSADATAHDPWVGLQWSVRPEQIEPQSPQARQIVARLADPAPQPGARRQL